MNAVPASSLRKVVLCNAKGVAALQKGDAVAAIHILRAALEELEGIEGAEENESCCSSPSSSAASSLFSRGSVKSVLLKPLTTMMSCGGSGSLFALLNRAFLFVLNRDSTETNLAEATSIILYNIGMCHIKLYQQHVAANNNHTIASSHNNYAYHQLQTALKLFSLAADIDTLSVEDEENVSSTTSNCKNSNIKNSIQNMFNLVLVGNMGFLHELLLNDNQASRCRELIQVWLQHQQQHPSYPLEEPQQDTSLISALCACPDVKSLCERVILSYHCPWKPKQAPAA